MLVVGCNRRFPRAENDEIGEAVKAMGEGHGQAVASALNLVFGSYGPMTSVMSESRKFFVGSQLC